MAKYIIRGGGRSLLVPFFQLQKEELLPYTEKEVYVRIPVD